MGLLTLLGVAGFFTGLATMFALARRWPRTVRALVGALAVVGFVLLGWAMSEGVWGAPGKIDFGSPGAESAFRIGYPLASLGTAAFLTGLIPRDPRWVGSKAAVAD